MEDDETDWTADGEEFYDDDTADPNDEEYPDDAAADEDDGGGYRLRFDGDVDPLHLAEPTPNSVELYRQFQRLEYEALADRKRKALALSDRPPPSKKPRQEDFTGATAEELEEMMMSFGGRRRRRRRRSDDPRRRGVKKGTKKKLPPEIAKKIGDATLLYSSQRYGEAIPLLEEVVKMKPNLPDSYHLLGLIYYAMGDRKKAMNFHMIAAHLTPKDPALWEKLIGWSIEQGNTGQVRYCLSKAITADPKDVGLRFKRALMYLEMGEYGKAAESYQQIVDMYPANVEARTMAAKMYQKCGQVERAIGVLEEYVRGHSSEAQTGVVTLLIDLLMEGNEHGKALELCLIYYGSKKKVKVPLSLSIKAAICHAHMGNMEDAQVLLQEVQIEGAGDNTSLITAAADSFVNLGYYACALKFYFMLKGIACQEDQARLCIKIAQCYVSIKERGKAIPFFYEALSTMEGDLDTRITLSSLLVEEGKVDDAIALLSPPKDSIAESLYLNSMQPKPWWFDGKIKVQLAEIYLAKGMLEDFADTIFSYVRETLIIESRNRKLRVKKRKRKLPTSVLHQRAKLLEEQGNNVFHGFKPIAKFSDLQKATRAQKALKKKEALKEERKSAALAAGVDWESEDSEDDTPREVGQAPLPGLLEDKERHQLIFDLCYALLSLQRYWEAFEIIYPALQVAHKKMSIEKKKELHSLATQIAFKTKDSKQAFKYAKYMVKQHPRSLAAWNCYHKVVSGFENAQHLKFLHRMRNQDEDNILPIMMHGHQFTLHSHHQDAARTYLEAYKLQPENALINLCVGTTLISLALGFRLQNKHQCLAQGFAFLYNYLRICHNSQEALYNMARACHHVGLVTIAVTYYEKVLAVEEKDYPIPRLPIEDLTSPKTLMPGYCDLRREAAHNLHLIYQKSGSLDLARQSSTPRVVKLGDNLGCPCGGTHVVDIADIKNLKVTQIRVKKGITKVSYSISP